VYQTTPCPAVAPNSANAINFQALLRKASDKGLVELFPEALSFWNSGVSFRLRRMYRAISTSTPDNKKGMRHPHDAKAASPTIRSVAMITPRDNSRPRVAVVWMYAVKYPRRSSGACSAT
jgi:hypothetical protein